MEYLSRTKAGARSEQGDVMSRCLRQGDESSSSSSSATGETGGNRMEQGQEQEQEQQQAAAKEKNWTRAVTVEKAKNPVPAKKWLVCWVTAAISVAESGNGCISQVGFRGW